jgi:hypothetical protein
MALDRGTTIDVSGGLPCRVLTFDSGNSAKSHYKDEQ